MKRVHLQTVFVLTFFYTLVSYYESIKKIGVLNLIKYGDEYY
ncbi:hypothetical protein HJ01_03076 [Flavobacterium frigoris PS1]|uniref:Uncharacterized protein n=1 Tax=Flavobacterium frigoris (strain PS1) TaxID=1086011 RepID=H7FV78_FLAFP|nr:hypothetical protein HJ01_03076 [Flavobacterium frigoris PS1]